MKFVVKSRRLEFFDIGGRKATPVHLRANEEKKSPRGPVEQVREKRSQGITESVACGVMEM
jgi:hypothetical protein